MDAKWDEKQTLYSRSLNYIQNVLGICRTKPADHIIYFEQFSKELSILEILIYFKTSWKGIIKKTRTKSFLWMSYSFKHRALGLGDGFRRIWSSMNLPLFQLITIGGIGTIRRLRTRKKEYPIKNPSLKNVFHCKYVQLTQDDSNKQSLKGYEIYTLRKPYDSRWNIPCKTLFKRWRLYYAF